MIGVAGGVSHTSSLTMNTALCVIVFQVCTQVPVTMLPVT